MRIKIIKHIHLDDADKCELVTKARDIDQGISKDEYLDYIECFISRVIDLLESEEVK
jgi:hypothetical protein